MSVESNIVNFSELEINQGQSPADFFATNRDQLITGGRMYVSFPLTSAGARWLADVSNSEWGSVEKAMWSLRINSMIYDKIWRGLVDSGEKLENIVVEYGDGGDLVWGAGSRSMCLKQVESVTFPSKIGKRWSAEIDYLSFWFYYLSGISAEGAIDFEKKLNSGRLGIDRDMFSNYEKSNEERRGLYGQFVEGFLSDLNEYDIDPVSAVCFFPGAGASLGCEIEGVLTQRLGVQRYLLVFDENNSQIGLVNNYVWRWAEKYRNGDFEIEKVAGDGKSLVRLLPL